MFSDIPTHPSNNPNVPNGIYDAVINKLDHGIYNQDSHYVRVLFSLPDQGMQVTAAGPGPTSQTGGLKSRPPAQGQRRRRVDSAGYLAFRKEIDSKGAIKTTLEAAATLVGASHRGSTRRLSRSESPFMWLTF